MRCSSSYLARIVFIFLFLSFSLSCFFIYYERPFLTGLSSQELSIGDTLTLKGRNLGSIRSSSLFVGGYEVLPRFIKEWTASSITFTICEAMGSGLIFVKNGLLSSNSLFFINRSQIPKFNLDTSISTTLLSLDKEKVVPTKEQVLKGLFLGLESMEKDLYFSYWDGVEKVVALPKSHIISWADHSLHFLMPAGISSGKLYIQDKKGRKSNELPYYVEEKVARWQLGKELKHKFKLLITLKREDKDDKECFCFGFPQPRDYLSLELGSGTACLNAYHKNGWLFYYISGSSEPFICLEQTYTLSVNEIEIFVNPDLIKPYNKKNLDISSFIVPSCIWQENSNLKDLIRNFKLPAIKNPYECAREIYNKFLLEFKPGEKSTEWGQLGKTVKNLSYGQFNRLFIDTLRYMDIPAREVLGILRSSLGDYRLWQWAEIYFEDLGWAPLDISLAYLNNDEYALKLSADHIALTKVPDTYGPTTITGQMQVLKDAQCRPLNLGCQAWLYEKIRGRGSLSLSNYEIVAIEDPF